MARKKTNLLFRSDGWVNLLKGLSGFSDVTKNTYFGDVPVLDDQELSRMWAGAGLGKKIVSRPADDMTRKWITIPNDPDGEILKELTRLKAEKKINEALKWKRLYRGSIIVMGLNDGRRLTNPAGKAKSIDWLRVYPATRISVSSLNLVTDPKSPYFEDIELFKVNKRNGGYFKVHHSRCLVFKGCPLPNSVDSLGDQYLYWGISELQSIWTDLVNYGGISQSIVNLLHECVIGKYKFDNLAQMLSEGNTAAIYTRMEVINASKSIINAVMLGAGEDYTRDSANMTGIPPMMDRFQVNLSASSEIPVTILFGRSPAGENATGESDIRMYYDTIVAKQKNVLLEPLQELVNHINSYLKVDKEPSIKFNNVWEPTQKEMVDMQKTQAESDNLYINNGTLSSEAVAESRFGGGEYSFETKLLEGEEKKIPVEKEPIPKPVEEEE